ncbi:hypothetical protein MMC28_002529 [Mycoblastus sanguinarius]|nr:hypothetical protein [Mycoblastus sanguinarius]
MVLGILTAVAACPAIIGTTEAVRKGQSQNAKERHRGQKANLVVQCTKTSKQSAQIDGGMVLLRDHKVWTRPLARNESGCCLLVLILRTVKLYINVPSDEELEFEEPPGHPFTGYFLPHPEYNWGWQGEGLVSTIAPGPPVLNWIYVDKETNEVKYGNKIEAGDHIKGPWNCTKIDRRMTFEGWEGFLAVREKAGTWALYFDREDDGLKGKVEGKRTLEIEVMRRERKKGKESADDKGYI